MNGPTLHAILLRMTLIGIRRQKFPFDDQTPLPPPARPRPANTKPAPWSGMRKWGCRVTSWR